MIFECWFGLVDGSRACHVNSKPMTNPNSPWSRKYFDNIESLCLYLLCGDIPHRTILGIRHSLMEGRACENHFDLFIEDARALRFI